VSFGIVSGPVIGGLLIDSFSWRAIFFVNIPVGIAATYLAIRYVPNLLPARSQRFDVLGAALMGITLLSLSLALTLGQEAGFASPMIITGFIVALLAGAAFVVLELRVESPMLELRLFSNPTLAVGVTSGFLTFVCLSATFLLLPFYLEGVLGLAVGMVGLLLGAGPLMMGVVSPFAGNLSDRLGVHRLTLFGLVVMAAAYFSFSSLDSDTTLAHYLMLAVPLGIGVGTFNSPNNSAIMGSVPPEYMGVGGGLLTVTRLLGQVSGIAILGSVWAASVAAASGGTLPGQGASSASPEAQVAGLHTTFRLAGVIMSLCALIGVWAMRRERRERLDLAGRSQR
jgi:MFS family permease